MDNELQDVSTVYCPLSIVRCQLSILFNSSFTNCISSVM